MAAASGVVAAPEAPASSMRDLRDHFAGCFQPPGVADTRVTFYFSLDARGGLIGSPRAIWFGFKGDAQERGKRLAAFVADFRKCLPVPLDRSMAAAIPGEVYYLQYVVGGEGREQQVLLRPFGSHGGIGPSIVEPGVGPIEPPLPEATGPRLGSFVPFRPHPQFRPFLRPRLFLPFRRVR